MTDAGLFMRRADPHDGRRVFVELAPDASDAMRRYFAEIGKVVANSVSASSWSSMFDISDIWDANV